MVNYTRKAIIDVFEEFLDEKPFDKITVLSIVERCGISSNTFYYHYRDIFNLLDVWVRDRADKIVSSLESPDSWTEILRAFLHTMQVNRKVVYNVWNSASREKMEKYVYDFVCRQMEKQVNEAPECVDMTDEERGVVTRFCSYSLLGYLLNFLWNDMDYDVDRAVDNLDRLFTGAVKNYITKS